jgi:hypothetical protein
VVVERLLNALLHDGLRIDLLPLLSWIADEAEPAALVQWAATKGDEGRAALARLIPAAPVPSTLAALEAFGPLGRFGRALARNYGTDVFSGSGRNHFEGLAAVAEGWSIDPTLPEGFRRWAAHAAAIQRERAESWGLMEDERWPPARG